MKNKLTSEEEHVIIGKGTERRFSGEYDQHFEAGTYCCRQCGEPLYQSKQKFDAGCGWPSFDGEIAGAVRRVADADGKRTEIVCAHCAGHLGHVFSNEHLTPANTRHCVNSISLTFKPASSCALGKTNASPETAVFAGGCFWGVEDLMTDLLGVQKTEVGYMGGHTKHPTYQQVCSHATGHREVVRIVFDSAQVSYETLAKLFFEIHDPTQINGQGPDMGEQYRSEIFYTSPQQKETALRLIAQLQKKGFNASTLLTPASEFWPAEEYHQHYYQKKGTRPACHLRVKRF